MTISNSGSLMTVVCALLMLCTNICVYELYKSGLCLKMWNSWNGVFNVQQNLDNTVVYCFDKQSLVCIHEIFDFFALPCILLLNSAQLHITFISKFHLVLLSGQSRPAFQNSIFYYLVDRADQGVVKENLFDNTIFYTLAIPEHYFVIKIRSPFNTGSARH